MKTKLKLILALLLYQTLCSGQSVRFSHNNWEQAIKTAKRQNKLVFIDTYAKWCIPCKKMEPVFRERELSQYFNEHFVNVKVDMDTPKGRKLHLKHNVIFLPTFLIMDQHGNVKYKSDRIMTGDDLLRAAKNVISPTYASADIQTTRSISTSSPQPTKTYTKKAPTTTRQSSTTKKETVRPSAETAKKYARPESIVKEEPGEKVLYVLDGNSNPNDPSFLKQEAYFRLQLADGSHMEKAKAYLATQDDWGTEENMKFILDFLNDIESDESLYLIINRKKFEAALGKDKVRKNLEFLVHNKLYQGYPRPSLQKSQAYLSYLDPTKSKKRAHKYFLLRLYDEENYSEYLKLSNNYLENMASDDEEILYRTALVLDKVAKGDSNLKKSIDLIERAIEVNKLSYDYLHTLATFHSRANNKRKAKKAAKSAIQIASLKNRDSSATQDLLNTLEK